MNLFLEEGKTRKHAQRIRGKSGLSSQALIRGVLVSLLSLSHHHEGFLILVGLNMLGCLLGVNHLTNNLNHNHGAVLSMLGGLAIHNSLVAVVLLMRSRSRGVMVCRVTPVGGTTGVGPMVVITSRTGNVPVLLGDHHGGDPKWDGDNGNAQVNVWRDLSRGGNVLRGSMTGHGTTLDNMKWFPHN